MKKKPPAEGGRVPPAAKQCPLGGQSHDFSILEWKRRIVKRVHLLDNRRQPSFEQHSCLLRELIAVPRQECTYQGTLVPFPAFASCSLFLHAHSIQRIHAAVKPKNRQKIVGGRGVSPEGAEKLQALSETRRKFESEFSNLISAGDFFISLRVEKRDFLPLFFLKLSVQYIIIYIYIISIYIYISFIYIYRDAIDKKIRVDIGYQIGGEYTLHFLPQSVAYILS